MKNKVARLNEKEGVFELILLKVHLVLKRAEKNRNSKEQFSRDSGKIPSVGVGAL